MIINYPNLPIFTCPFQPGVAAVDEECRPDNRSEKSITTF